MLSRKNRQNVAKDLVFLDIAILCTTGTKILCVFNWQTTFHKHLETSVFNQCF